MSSGSVHQSKTAAGCAANFGGAARFTATDAKNEFGKVLDTAMQSGLAVFTKHDAAKAVLMSIDEYNFLSQAGERKLNTLSEEFDALLDQMQAPDARAAMQAAFDSSPKDLGKVAVWAARKRVAETGRKP